MVNDYDKRQLNLMKEKISLYNQNSLMLLSLINDLESLVNVLETVSDSWKEEFRSWVWDIEEIYAVALDRNQQSLDTEDSRLVTNALNKIEALINGVTKKGGAGSSETQIATQTSFRTDRSVPDTVVHIEEQG